MTESCCRRASHDTDVAASPALLSESEASELFGDYIDEDSQTVQRVRPLSHAPMSCAASSLTQCTGSMHSSSTQCTRHWLNALITDSMPSSLTQSTRHWLSALITGSMHSSLTQCIHHWLNALITDSMHSSLTECTHH